MIVFAKIIFIHSRQTFLFTFILSIIIVIAKNALAVGGLTHHLAIVHAIRMLHALAVVNCLVVILEAQDAFDI
jgi:hypothetical protein